MHALASAHELRLDEIVDQLLQDFMEVCPGDYSSQFIAECLPLMFNIFRYVKVNIDRHYRMLIISNRYRHNKNTL